MTKETNSLGLFLCTILYTRVNGIKTNAVEQIVFAGKYYSPTLVNYKRVTIFTHDGVYAVQVMV